MKGSNIWGQVIGRDAEAAIGDGETHGVGASAFFCPPNPDAQATAMPHRMDRVAANAGDDLAGSLGLESTAVEGIRIS
jgi:hypothetical protein